MNILNRQLFILSVGPGYKFLPTECEDSLVQFDKVQPLIIFFLVPPCNEASISVYLVFRLRRKLPKPLTLSFDYCSRRRKKLLKIQNCKYTVRFIQYPTDCRLQYGTFRVTLLAFFSWPKFQKPLLSRRLSKKSSG